MCPVEGDETGQILRQHMASQRQCGDIHGRKTKRVNLNSRPKESTPGRIGSCRTGFFPTRSDGDERVPEKQTARDGKSVKLTLV